MAARGKTLEQEKKFVNTTFETSSIDSTAVEEKLFGQLDQEVNGEEGPVVFICGNCKLPVGDSLSWDGVEVDENQIRLKRVTHNVIVGKENRLLEVNKRFVCLVQDLTCRGCCSIIGIVYCSTPKSLDDKRFSFCLNVGDIDSYVFGSAGQMLTAEGPKEQPVTLEYRGAVEQQLTEMKMLVLSMAHRLEEIEIGLQDSCGHA